MPPDDTLAALELEPVARSIGFARDATTPTLLEPRGERIVGFSREVVRSLHSVLERERAGAWRGIFKTTGVACGKDFAAALDRALAQSRKPALAALPLEACLSFAQRRFAAHGWGGLDFDLAAAPQHGIVVAQLQRSFFVEALADATGFVDPFFAGFLRAFFEHVTGDSLGCEEIACARAGAPACSFILAAPERIARIAPFIGRESAGVILARLTR